MGAVVQGGGVKAWSCLHACCAWFVTQEFYQLPGDIHKVSSVEAHNIFVNSGAMLQILGWIFLLELVTVPALYDLRDGKRAPGDYAFDPLKLGKGSN